ncbi:MAG: leucine-rich repeat domain-containing protein [Clostridia bacterium]|nr:leucine-rich repeat domain-containing protein [Clostridia bacterium]
MADSKDFLIENGVLKRYKGKSKNVVVPEGVTAIGKRAFSNKQFIESVIIPEGVIVIKTEAFVFCDNLKHVLLPDTLKTISEGAFSNCFSLESIEIPDDVEVIGRGAFHRCGALKNIKFPEKLKEIGFRVFFSTEWEMKNQDEFIIINSILYKYNGNKPDVIIPEGVTVISAGAFNNSGLTAVTIPDSVKIIKDYAFCSCRKLSSIVIPEGVTEISESAFYNCEKLKEIFLPQSLVNLGYDVFGGCKSLERFVFYGKIEKFRGSTLELFWNEYSKRANKAVIMYSLLSQYFDFIKTEKSVISKIKANKKLVIDYAIKYDNAEVIERLFSLFKDISFDELNEYIEKSKSVVAISAFLIEYKSKHFSSKKQALIENDRIEKDFGLKEKTLADWKREFGFVVKNDEIYITSCKLDFETVVIPGRIGKRQVAGVSAKAFSGNKTVKSVILPEGMKSIGEYAFFDCENLEDVYLPDTITEVACAAFKWSSKLKNIKLPDSLEYLGEWAFGGCWEIEEIIIPSGVTKILSNAFYGCSKLKKVVMSDNVTELGEQAFCDCEKLKYMTISKNIETVGKSAFFGTEWLDSLKDDFIIPGSALYKYRGKDKKVIIPDGVKSISFGAFEANEFIEEVVIPESVISVDGWAFANCKNLKKVKIPSTLERVKRNVFEGTEFLQNNKEEIIVFGKVLYRYLCNGTHAEVPEGVTCIAPFAFDFKGNKIESVTLPKTLKTIEENAFSGCYKLKRITIPDGVSFIGYAAFRYCENLNEITIPESVEFIESEAFTHCKNLKKAIFLGEPDLEEYWQFSKCNKELVIYTPKNSKLINLAKRYKTAVQESE